MSQGRDAGKEKRCGVPPLFTHAGMRAAPPGGRRRGPAFLPRVDSGSLSADTASRHTRMSLRRNRSQAAEVNATM